MRRLLIGGTQSGCGKTTVTCALLSAIKERGLSPTAFKCGPDYIDPMFHRAALGVPSYNLDPFFLDGESLRHHLAARAKGFAVIEGAMGYYDGIGVTEECSAYTVAQETDTPVVLVVSARRAGHSLSAVIEGFFRHRPNNKITGVIFNDASEKRAGDLEKTAREAGVRFYGVLPRKELWRFPNRHLGLMTADEIENLQAGLVALGRAASRTLDMDGLLALAETAPAIPPADTGSLYTSGKDMPLRLAVAVDKAFCFRYEENMELLRDLGCELAFFSPLQDEKLPERIHGLYLCGGYPELHTSKLSQNSSMLTDIRQAVENGLPTIAECGGFLFLHQCLDGAPMCGVIDGTAYKTEKLQRFGYITLTARKNNLLCKANESIRAHEFHYWDSDSPGDGFMARKAGRDITYTCVHAGDTLYAGFPHLYFPANPEFAKNFVERMKQVDPE